MSFFEKLKLSSDAACKEGRAAETGQMLCGSLLSYFEKILKGKL
jgi:hypothetical protein